MLLFEMSIPLMILAVCIAAVPLIVVSRREVSELVREAEMKFERHRREHPVGHRGVNTRHTHGRAGRGRPREHSERPWYEPVFVDKH